MLDKAEPNKVVENTIMKMESQSMPLETLAKIWFMLALFFKQIYFFHQGAEFAYNGHRT
jgi:hypothetical protein